MINCCEVLEKYNKGVPIEYKLADKGELIFQIQGRRLKPTTVQLIKRQGKYKKEGTFFQGTITRTLKKKNKGRTSKQSLDDAQRISKQSNKKKSFGVFLME